MIDALVEEELEEEDFDTIPDEEEHGAARIEVGLVVRFWKSILFVWIPSSKSKFFLGLLIFYLHLLSHDRHRGAWYIEPAYSRRAYVCGKFTANFFDRPCFKVLSFI